MAVILNIITTSPLLGVTSYFGGESAIARSVTSKLFKLLICQSTSINHKIKKSLSIGHISVFPAIPGVISLYIQRQRFLDTILLTSMPVDTL